MKKLFPVISAILFLPFFCTSQEVVASAGNCSNHASVQISWSLGEPVIETWVNTQTVLTQGFHQPKLIVTAIHNLTVQNLALKVFPNPTSDYVILEITKGNFENLQYSLFDLSGKLLLQKKVLSNCEQLGMQPFSTGAYFFKVTNRVGHPLQTFKIIKK